MAVEKNFQLRPPPREAAEYVVESLRRAEFVAEAKLFVDEIGGGLGVVPEFRMPGEEVLGDRAFALPPAARHLRGEIGRERRGGVPRHSRRRLGGRAHAVCSWDVWVP